MEQYLWVLWTVLGISLIIAEIFTLGFVLLWFGVGALLAAFAAFLGVGLGFQFLIFGISVFLLTLLSKKIFHNRIFGNDIKTGVDSLPGQIGIVTVGSKGALSAGEVKVFGSTWTAFPEQGEKPLLTGDKVEVVEIKGSSIFVRKLRESPDWRDEH